MALTPKAFSEIMRAAAYADTQHELSENTLKELADVSGFPFESVRAAYERSKKMVDLQLPPQGESVRS